jgi:hypothetical protein
MWSIGTRTFLEAHGYDIWYSVVIGYNCYKESKDCSQEGIEEE